MRNSLSHYGVLGMHWGVRRASVSRGKKRSISPEAKERAKKVLNLMLVGALGTAYLGHMAYTVLKASQAEKIARGAKMVQLLLDRPYIEGHFI